MWGLNLEFGVAGVANLAYIALVAVGAYAYAVLTLGSPSRNVLAQHYILGYHWPFPLAVAGAAVAGAVFGVLIGITGLKRLRQDYQAMVMLVVSLMLTTVVSADTGLLNGLQGLALIPGPASAISSSSAQWTYVGLVALTCVIGYFVLRRFTGGPMGRTLRAMRDDEDAALAVGKDVIRLRLLVQAVGGAFAAVSGALLVAYIGGWSPGAWAYVETLALLTAAIVGGLGNDAGALVGTLLIPILILQGVQFLPQVQSHTGLTEAFGWIVLGLLTIAFVWFRPQGMVPERRRRYRLGGLARVRARGAAGTAIVGPAGNGGDASAAGRRSVPGLDWGVWLGGAPGAVAPPRASAEERARPILLVEDLSKRFGGVRAVDGASFTVEEGSITGLIGPNGAGKSTVLGMVNGFIRPTGGRVVFDGVEVTRASVPRRARRGLVRTFQLPREFGRLTTLDNLLVAAPGQRGESALGLLAGRAYWRAQEEELVDRARQLLDVFGMAEKEREYGRALSGGQKRILEIMRALMTAPRLLLLDEPMAGLSPAVARSMQDAFLELSGRGLTLLLVEHELDAVERCCTKVVAMAQGRVISEGSMAELRTRQEVKDAYVIG